MVHIVRIRSNTFCWHSLLAQSIWIFFGYCLLPLVLSMESFGIRQLCVYFNAIVWMEFILHHDYMLSNNENAIIRIPCHACVNCVSFENSLWKKLSRQLKKIHKLAIPQTFGTFIIELFVSFETILFYSRFRAIMMDDRRWNANSCLFSLVTWITVLI